VLPICLRLETLTSHSTYCIAIPALTVYHPGMYFKSIVPGVTKKKTLGSDSSDTDV
jgi:hypothetical protein